MSTGKPQQPQEEPNEFNSLMKLGWVKTVDIVYGVMIFLNSIVSLVLYLTHLIGFRAEVACLCLTLAIAQIWLVFLIYRAMYFVLKVLAEIKILSTNMSLLFRQ